MPNRRMITSEMWQDDFIGSLTFFERLVFVGLITCVDDQGRMMSNPIIILAHAFPYDRTIRPEQVTAALEKIAKAGKVVCYEASGKPLLQIVKWWIYQTPSWASPSRFPTPPGWVDRIKYHTAGNKIECVNWDSPGGYVDVLPSPLPSRLDSMREKEEVKDESESKDELQEVVIAELPRPPEPPPQPAAPPASGLAPAPPQPPLTEGQLFLLDSLGAKRFKNNTQRAAVLELETTYGTDKLKEAARWAATKGLGVGEAIGAIKSALPKWGQPKPAKPLPNGAKPQSVDDPIERARKRHGLTG